MALYDINGNPIKVNGESSTVSNLSLIRKMNDERHAFRIATFNVKGSGGFGQNNWYMLKECLEDYGVDICGMQEVAYPLQNLTGKGTFAEYFKSNQFPHVSDNGDAYGVEAGSSDIGKNERMMLSRYPIDSTTETYYKTQSASGDYRYLAKSVITLPRYMDKRGSEKLKLSVYNTQLEVINPTTTQAQAREIVEIVAQDENPFIIIMGDTNDFTLDKEVWKIFEEAGFATVVSTNTSTVAGTYDFNCIDNFFLSKRIKALNHNVVWGQDYPWSGSEMLSDHDLVIADVELDYSDIRCLNYKTLFCSVQTSTGRDWLTEEETMTVTVTPYDGYELSSVSVRDTMVDITSTAYANGTVTLTGADLRGDVFISATATRTANAEPGIMPLKNGTYTDSSGWSATVTNGNHVAIMAGNYSLRQFKANISDVSKATNTAVDTELFVIPAGSTVEFSVSNHATTSTEWVWFDLNFAETETGTLTKLVSGRGNASINMTIPDELSVGCLVLSIGYDLTANATLEFDVSLAVNGTMYI